MRQSQCLPHECGPARRRHACGDPGLILRLARDRGFYRDELIAEIAQRGGRGYSRLPAEVRAAFPIAAIIAPEWHLRMHASVQHHVDAAASKTVNLPASDTIDGARAIYLAAWKAKVKGITINRYGSREGQVLPTRRRNPTGPSRYGSQRRMCRAQMQFLRVARFIHQQTKSTAFLGVSGHFASRAGEVSFGPRALTDPRRSNEIMRHRTELPPILDVDVTTHVRCRTRLITGPAIIPGQPTNAASCGTSRSLSPPALSMTPPWTRTCSTTSSHLFTENGTGIASVLYRAGPTGYSLAQVAPVKAEQFAPFDLPVTIGAQPAPCLTSGKPSSGLACSACRFCLHQCCPGPRQRDISPLRRAYGLITPAG